MNRDPSYRQRLALGALGLLSIYLAAYLKLSGQADRLNAWLAGLW